MSRNEKRRMSIYVVTGIVLVAVVAVLSVAVLKKRDSKMPRQQIRLIWMKTEGSILLCS